MNFTTEIATDIIFPNIIVYRKYCDDVLSSYEMYPNEGYMVYDTMDENYDIDQETFEMTPVTRYYTWVTFPATFNFDNFTWVAVPEHEINIKNQNIATEEDYQNALREMGVNV